MEDGETLLLGLCSQRPSQGVTSELGDDVEEEKAKEKLYIMSRQQEQLLNPGLEGGTHLEFAKNQTISSLESEQGRVRRCGKGNWV